MFIPWGTSENPTGFPEIPFTSWGIQDIMKGYDFYGNYGQSY
jgi:hypothetical protein